MKLNRIKQPTNILFNIIFIILSLVSIIPFVFVFIISITSETSIRKFGYRFFPKELSMSAYEFLWNEKDIIINALGISVLVTVVGTLVGVILTTALGYVLSRPNYKLKGFLTWVVFIPMVFNGGMVASYVVNANILGLKNSIWALILPLAVSSFNVVICKTFFRTTVPDSIIESAKIDGATNAIVNITGGMDITIYDANEAVEFIREAAGGDVDIIFGVAINEDVGDSIIVTVIATGFDFDSKVADPKDYKSRVKKEAVKTISKELGTEVEVEDLDDDSLIPSFIRQREFK